MATRQDKTRQFCVVRVGGVNKPLKSPLIISLVFFMTSKLEINETRKTKTKLYIA